MPCHYNEGPSRLVPDPETERALCEARWIIYTLLKYHVEPKGIPDDLDALIKRHMKEQRRHRCEDRDYVVRQLDARIRGIIDNCADIEKRGGEPKKWLLDEKEALRAMKLKVQALTVSDLMEEYWRSEKCVAEILGKR